MPTATAGAGTIVPKRLINFRASQEAERILDEMRERLGVTSTAIIEMALRDWYSRQPRDTQTPVKKNRKPR